MKQLAAFILGLFLTSPALADGTINTLSAGAALTGTELLPMFQTANPAVTTTPNALKTFVTATGVVTSITNSDGTLTISPTSGAAVASLALGHANTWTGIQTFSTANGIVYSGATTGTQVACLGLDASNNVIKSAAACGSGGGGTPAGPSSAVQYNNSSAFGGDASFEFVAPGKVTIAGGSIAANAIALNITQTWNNAAVTFDAPLLVNVTNTASAAASNLVDIQSGGTSMFAIGQQPAGGPALIRLPGSSFIVSANAATFINASPTLRSLSLYAGNGFGVGSGNTVYFSAGGGGDVLGGTADSAIWLDASGTSPSNNLAIGSFNGSTAEGLRVYNNTDHPSTSGTTAPTNYERAVFDFTTTANVLTIGTQKGAAGTLRNFQFVGGAGATGGANSQVADFGVTNGASWSFYNPTYFYHH